MNEWDTGFVSVRGKNHLRSNQRNQDYIITLCNDGCSIFIASDGAGSTPCGWIGARLITKFITYFINLTNFKSPKRDSEILTQIVNVSIKLLKTFVKDLSPEEQIEFLFNDEVNMEFSDDETDEIRNLLTNNLDDFCCTLLFVAATETEVFTAHVGDGYIFTGDLDCKDGLLKIVDQHFSYPENGEYDNQTFFVTDYDVDEHLRITSYFIKTNTIIVMTDGADNFLIAPNRKDLHLPVIQKINDLRMENKEKLTLQEILKRSFTQRDIFKVSDDDASIGMSFR